MQFDNAVSFLGSVLESALEEMEDVGTDKNPKWQPRYKLSQLLDPDFRLGDDRVLTPDMLKDYGVFD